MRSWSFHSQVFFLSKRLRHHRALLDHPGSVIQDRSIYEDAEIFAKNLYRQGNMSDRDYGTYRELYEVLTLYLPPPDLVVYLRASTETLIKRITLRGREYERDISPDYLARLNDLYEEWIDNSRCARCSPFPPINSTMCMKTGIWTSSLRSFSSGWKAKKW